MKLEVYEKLIPTKIIKLGEKEYDLYEVIQALSDILYNTEEDDRYGDFSLRDYELEATRSIYEYFAKEGYIKNYTGSRMANLFCLAKGKTEELERLLDKLYEIIEGKSVDMNIDI